MKAYGKDDEQRDISASLRRKQQIYKELPKDRSGRDGMFGKNFYEAAEQLDAEVCIFYQIPQVLIGFLIQNLARLYQRAHHQSSWRSSSSPKSSWLCRTDVAKRVHLYFGQYHVSQIIQGSRHISDLPGRFLEKFQLSWYLGLRIPILDLIFQLHPMPPQIENGDVSIDEYFQVKKEDSGLPITGLQVFEYFQPFYFSPVKDR